MKKPYCLLLAAFLTTCMPLMTSCGNDDPVTSEEIIPEPEPEPTAGCLSLTPFWEQAEDTADRPADFVLNLAGKALTAPGTETFLFPDTLTAGEYPVTAWNHPDDSGTVQNVVLENVQITNDNSSGYAGGIAGSTNNSASLIGCYATGDVTVENDGTRNSHAGGVVGYNGSGTLTACYAWAA